MTRALTEFPTEFPTAARKVPSEKSIKYRDYVEKTSLNTVISSSQFSNLVKKIIDKGAKTLYLAIFNSSNQRSYITVKLN